MRLISTFMLICFYLVKLNSQEVISPLNLFCTAGSTGNISIQSELQRIEWSLGEIIIHTGLYGNSTITQGEQQAFPNDLHVGISEQVSSKMIAYPNPANRFITLDQMPEGHKTIFLQSYCGLPISTYSTYELSITIPSSQLPSGLYFLMIRLNDQNVKTIKIAIVNP